MDRQTVLSWIDVGKAGARNHKMESVRCNCAIEQLMRSARMLRPRIAIRVAARTNDLAFVLRGLPVSRDRRAGSKTPRVHRQWLGSRAGDGRANGRPDGTRQGDTAAKKNATI